MSVTSMQPSPAGREPTDAEREATRWVARCDAGLTSTQQAEFERWLAADPRHAELFEEYDGAWALFDRVRETPESAENDTAVLAFEPRATVDVHARPLRQRIIGAWVATTLATAAALAWGYIGWWRPTHFTETARTEIGHVRMLALPDGSSVELNTDSVVSVSYSRGERRLHLERGEAHFIVAKDVTRPFVVMANGVAVRAVGTAFNVRLRPEAIEVVVAEGRVRVDDGQTGGSLLPEPRMVRDAIRESSPAPQAAVQADGERVLRAGQRVVVTVSESPSAAAAPTTGVIVPLAADELRRQLAWQERRLEFVLAPLAEIAAEFNRYNRHKIVIADDRLAARRFGGSFLANDPARFVRMLQDNFSVLAEKRESETVLRLAP